jgi:hypothetical protein
MMDGMVRYGAEAAGHITALGYFDKCAVRGGGDNPGMIFTVEKKILAVIRPPFIPGDKTGQNLQVIDAPDNIYIFELVL